MALLILLALVGLPLVEIAVFIRIGSDLGLGLTLLITILTAFAGVLLMRAQGFSTLMRLQATLDQGEVPLRPMFDGTCQVMAGLFLLIPGFVTDFMGLLLFLPPVRAALLWILLRRSNVTVVVSRSGAAASSPSRTYDVDGEYRDVTDHPGRSITDKTRPDPD